jgi:hypothetical protein
MPWKTTQRRATADRRRGKSASTQAGEYVKEQLHKEKRGKGRAKSPKQAIAIGLSQARRSGVKVPRKKGGSTRRRATGRGSTGRGASRKRSSRSRSR